MNSVSIPVALRKHNKVMGEFYPLQKDELMAMRKAKLINNAAYVHLALRNENPFCDRPVEIRPKEFALRWQIPEVSVYKAIAKLKDLCVLAIKAGKIIVEWIFKPKAEQLSIPLSDKKPSKKQSTSDEPSFKAEPITDFWDDEPQKNFDYQNGKKLSNPKKLGAESVIKYSFCDPLDSSDRSNQPDGRETKQNKTWRISQQWNC